MLSLFLCVDIPVENLPWAPSLLPLYCRTINTAETQQKCTTQIQQKCQQPTKSRKKKERKKKEMLK